jgi:hypothetical protein
MRRLRLIVIGTIAAALSVVGVWVAVIWFRVPGPEFTTQQWAFITAHASDPRVQACFGPAGHIVTFPAHTTTGVSEIASETVVLREGSHPAAFLACMRTRLHGG